MAETPPGRRGPPPIPPAALRSERGEPPHDSALLAEDSDPVPPRATATGSMPAQDPAADVSTDMLAGLGAPARPAPMAFRSHPNVVPRRRLTSSSGVPEPIGTASVSARYDAAVAQRAAAYVGEIVGAVAREAEAATEPERAADLHARVALLAWDVGDEATSRRHATLATGHPLACALIFGHALASAEPGMLERAEEAVRGLPDGVPALLRELAEAWLYRADDPARAADLLRELASMDPDDREVRELLVLALALGGSWDELAAVLEASGGALAGAVVEAAHVHADRRADPVAAAAGLTALDGDLHALQRLVELAETADGGALDLVALLRRKLELLSGGDHPDAQERNATTFLLAELLAQRGRPAEAMPLLGALTVPSGLASGWGARLALHAVRRVAATLGAWGDAAQATADLARATRHAGLARTYLRRAAELFDARAGDVAQAAALYAEIHAAEPGDAGVARALERLRVQGGDWAGLVGQLSRAGRHGARGALRRAAAVAESRLGDLGAALHLRRELSADEAGPPGHDETARLLRLQGERARLIPIYRRDARAAIDAGDARAAATWLCGVGALELAFARSPDAEEAFAEAARLDPRDPCARLGLAALYVQAGRWRELADVLRELVPLCVHESVRAASLRELARVTANRLGDVVGARALLDGALDARSDDSAALQALAELAEDAEDWSAAIALRERAVASAGPERAAELLVEIAAIEAERRGDDPAALAAYERALAADGRSAAALRGLQDLHRRAGRSVELLSALRLELALPAEGTRRLALLVEAGALADAMGDPAAAFEDLRAALWIDPGCEPALTAIEELCRREGRWDVLADALAGASSTARHRRALAEAYEHLGRWGELAELWRLDLDAGDLDPAEAIAGGLSLARVLEAQLGDLPGAVDVYRRCAELDPSDPRPLRALARLLEAQERWGELVEVLQHEIALPSLEDGPRATLLARVAELLRDRLDRPSDAARAWERVLVLEPAHLDALAALETLYAGLGRDAELELVLERRAAVSLEPATRSAYWTRAAELRERRGDLDGALACHQQAFAAEPANRATFTALERLCYRRERWPDAMALYDGAIALVEAGRSRSYRLSDLYARRGQVQLQYLGQLAEAAASYLRVVELDPDHDAAMRFLESIYAQQGDWAALIVAYERRADLLADDERRVETFRRAARVAAAKRKDPAEAARLYERLLGIDQTDGEALDALERFHEKGRDWQRLVTVLGLRLATAPAGDDAVKILTRIATLCEEGLRDEQRAIEHWRRVLEIAPGHKEALDALGRIYESTERWPEFIDVTRRQIRVTTDRNVKALLYFKCGSVMESKFGKEEDATRYYDAAIKTSSSCLPAVHGLRDLYLRRRDWVKVIQTLEIEVKLWQDDKERAGVLAQIGHIYGDNLHDHERAVSYYEQALAVDPDSLPANRALFELYFARGDWARAAPLAQALAQKAMREGDPSERSEFYRKRGLVAWHAGDARAAAESFVIALEIKPENQTALDELGRLARAEPTAYDFSATYRELERIYRRRDDAAPHLARVLVAQAAAVERAGDLDAAESSYRDAAALAPDDFGVLLAQIDLHVAMRRWQQAAELIVGYLERTPPPPLTERSRALLRLAEIHGDGEMDPARAALVLRELLRFDPTHQEALYRLAQELYLLGDYGGAREQIEAAIEVAASPGKDPTPDALARYYYYYGHVLEKLGDGRGANAQYRRAAEYDPGDAPTALALARRALAAGDRRAAEGVLIQAAHAAMAKGGPRAAVPLQRGLARILLQAGDRRGAIEAYRGILAVVPNGSDDRVALAEVYAMEDVPKAVQELHRVLERDLRHAPAYRQLAALYERIGEPERALRANAVLELLGYSDDGERAQLATARARHVFVARRGAITDELRASSLLPAAGRSILGDIYAAVAPEVAGLYLMPPPGTNLVPAAQLDDEAFRAAIADNARLFGVAPDVYVGDEVHGGMIVLLHPRPIVTIARDLFERPDPERRFLLGRAFESLRGGYAPLMRLGPRERAEVGSLLRALLLPEAERPAAAHDFVRQLPRRAQKALERFAGAVPAQASPAAVAGEFAPVADPLDPEPWFAALAQAQDRAGILACDDFAAAARAIALLSGEELAVDPSGAVALGAVPGGADLMRYFLSDEYQRLRTALAEPAA